MNSRGEAINFDFEELANHLLEQGLEASPAELHGCLCGLLAAGAGTTAKLAWTRWHRRWTGLSR